MMCRMLPLAALALATFAQKYEGPRPEKADLPYLKHAESLLPLEIIQATEQKGKKDEITYIMAGAASNVRTPLASPQFLFQASKIAPDSLELYRLETRNGRRELPVSPRRPPKLIRTTINRLTSDNLYRIEVDESLTAGEYSFSPKGVNVAFCFQVF
jgi:hypothetical protein